MKTDYLHQLTSGKGVTFLTGTPIANTMCEAWTMQRYLQPELLKQLGAYAFDDWKSMFGEVETTNRIDPLGRKYRTKERFNRFMNLAELRRMWAQSADIKMGYAPAQVPPLAGGKPQPVEVEPSPLIQDYMLGLGRRAGSMPQDRSIDNILKAMTEGRKVATDPRLLEAGFPPLDETKLTAAADNMLQVYRETSPFKGVQVGWLDIGVPKAAKKLTPEMVTAGQWLLGEIEKGDVSIEGLYEKFSEICQRKDKAKVFSNWLRQIDQDVEWQHCDEDDDGAYELFKKDDDEGVPAVHVNAIRRVDPDVISQKPPPWNAYKEIKDRLVAGGIPEKEIAFIHDFDTASKKLALFDQLNSGEKRIILASTFKMGTGANIQKRLVAEHHIDAPFRPDQLEQHRGRMLRVGNLSMDLAKEAGVDLPGVRSYQYVTKGTIDARFWQILEDKARMLRQFYNGDEKLARGTGRGRGPRPDGRNEGRGLGRPAVRGRTGPQGDRQEALRRTRCVRDREMGLRPETGRAP